MTDEKTEKAKQKMAKPTPGRDLWQERPLPPATLGESRADDDIDLERVVYDPEYRRWALRYLNTPSRFRRGHRDDA